MGSAVCGGATGGVAAVRSGEDDGEGTLSGTLLELKGTGSGARSGVAYGGGGGAGMVGGCPARRLSIHVGSGGWSGRAANVAWYRPRGGVSAAGMASATTCASSWKSSRLLGWRALCDREDEAGVEDGIGGADDGTLLLEAIQPLRSCSAVLSVQIWQWPFRICSEFSSASYMRLSMSARCIC